MDDYWERYHSPQHPLELLTSLIFWCVVSPAGLMSKLSDSESFLCPLHSTELEKETIRRRLHITARAIVGGVEYYYSEQRDWSMARSHGAPRAALIRDCAALESCMLPLTSTLLDVFREQNVSQRLWPHP